MIAYQAPLKDLKFVLYDLLHYEQHYQNLSKSSALTRDDIDAIMVEAAKFSQQVIAPLNRVGDEQGCQWHPEGGTGRMQASEQEEPLDAAYLQL